MILGTTTSGDPLAIDLDRLIGSHALAIANSGGGKSGLLRRLLEVTAPHVQQIVLDIEDELYTLRECHSYVIAGGDGADIPATIHGARALALAALEHGFSLIVQLNDFGEDAPEFVAEFLAGLMNAPRELWHPALVVIDELQRFAPNGEATAATAAVKDLVQRGRKRGFTMIGASLSMVEVNPRVRGLVNNWLLGRAGQELDRTAMARQLGFSAKDGRERLHGLTPRSFWGLGPAISDEPLLFRVADVETTPVRPGQAKVATPPAPEALREILAGLAVVDSSSWSGEKLAHYETAENRALSARMEESEAERAKLAHRVAELEAELAERDRIARHTEFLLTRLHADIGTALQNNPVSVAPAAAPTALEPVGGSHVDRSAVRAPLKPKGPDLGKGSGPTDAKIGPERRPLAVLAGVYPSGMTEAQWATAAGLKRTSGTWSTYKGRLRTGGLIEKQGDIWLASEAGALAVGDVETPPPPGPELVRWWVGKLRSVAPMAEMLIKRWPKWTRREELADLLNMSPTSGTFSSYLGRLSTPGLIERDRDRGIRLSAEVMGK